MKLQFEYKRVYGRPKFYPLDKISCAYLNIMEKACLNPIDFMEVLRTKEVEVFEKDIKLTPKEIVERIEKHIARQDTE